MTPLSQPGTTRGALGCAGAADAPAAALPTPAAGGAAGAAAAADAEACPLAPAAPAPVLSTLPGGFPAGAAALLRGAELAAAAPPMLGLLLWLLLGVWCCQRRAVTGNSSLNSCVASVVLMRLVSCTSTLPALVPTATMLPSYFMLTEART